VTGGSAAPAAAGAVILLDALAARLALGASETGVSILGRPVAWQCSLRRVGLPCLTCGMTRSVVLALHGQWARAWQVAPGGPVLTAGLLALAVALLLLAVLERWNWPKLAAGVRRLIRRGGLAYAAAAVVVWFAGWAVSFAAAWPGS